MERMRSYTHADYRDNTVVVVLDDFLIRLDRDSAIGLASDINDVADEIAHQMVGGWRHEDDSTDAD